jgi:hypothetical protein
MLKMALQSKVLQEHEKINEKQRQIEESFVLNIDSYKVKILCVQCGQESEKIKCKDCRHEDFHTRNKYLVCTGLWITSSVVLSASTANFLSSIPVGFCVSIIASEIYNKLKF